jgi:dolichol-phosphate mannosyltransferase
MTEISIVIPCYNEAGNVAHLLEEFYPAILGLLQPHYPEPALAKSVEVIFVDDGSQDNTLELLRKFFLEKSCPGVSFRCERHRINRGLGAALRTGFAACSGDIIVTTDSDGTYRFEEIPNLLKCLQPGIDIVTASPYHPKGGVMGVPVYRLILSRGSSLVYRILVRWDIYTYTALFRVYSRQVIEEVQFEADGFLAGTELLVKSMLKGYKVAEYPAVLYSRRLGVSKARLLHTMLAHLRFQGWILVDRLLPAGYKMSKEKV